jgi:hypothetical protein
MKINNVYEIFSDFLSNRSIELQTSNTLSLQTNKNNQVSKENINKN